MEPPSTLLGEPQETIQMPDGLHMKLPPPGFWAFFKFLYFVAGTSAQTITQQPLPLSSLIGLWLSNSGLSKIRSGSRLSWEKACHLCLQTSRARSLAS